LEKLAESGNDINFFCSGLYLVIGIEVHTSEEGVDDIALGAKLQSVKGK